MSTGPDEDQAESRFPLFRGLRPDPICRTGWSGELCAGPSKQVIEHALA